MDKATHERFISSWGMMGSLWGINPSVARVHALLITSEEPLSLDQIAKTLFISRGNASMCLKELRNWTIVRPVKKPGDRQDYYESESDVWKMFIAIGRGRKRREFDPVMSVVHETLAGLSKDSGAKVQDRLRQMDELLRTLNLIAERFLADEKTAKSVLPLVARFEGVSKLAGLLKMPKFK